MTNLPFKQLFPEIASEGQIKQLYFLLCEEVIGEDEEPFELLPSTPSETNLMIKDDTAEIVGKNELKADQRHRLKELLQVEDE